jgi:hypothetical protein
MLHWLEIAIWMPVLRILLGIWRKMFDPLGMQNPRLDLGFERSRWSGLNRRPAIYESIEACRLLSLASEKRRYSLAFYRWMSFDVCGKCLALHYLLHSFYPLLDALTT